MQDIPLRKQPTLTKKIVLAITEETYKEFYECKEKGVDMPEWLRRLLEQELPKLKKRL